MSTLPHPLRRAMLRRACHADIESDERANLIKLAVPQLDPEYVLKALLEAHQAHEEIRGTDAEATFARLVDEDQTITQGDASGKTE